MPPRFRAVLFYIEETGGWYFVEVPPEHAPDTSGPWGRSPVTATVDGRQWDTSAWHDSRRGWLLPVDDPARG